MTWFLLLATALTDLYLIHDTLVSSELENQARLMDAEEAFYQARNFEHEFRHAVSTGSGREFLHYWSRAGELTYGTMGPNNTCVQSQLSFKEFLEAALLHRGEALIFSPLGLEESCVTLRVGREGFKTFGVIKSTVCINTSSPLFLC